MAAELGLSTAMEDGGGHMEPPPSTPRGRRRTATGTQAGVSPPAKVLDLAPEADHGHRQLAEVINDHAAKLDKIYNILRGVKTKTGAKLDEHEAKHQGYEQRDQVLANKLLLLEKQINDDGGGLLARLNLVAQEVADNDTRLKENLQIMGILVIIIYPIQN